MQFSERHWLLYYISCGELVAVTVNGCANTFCIRTEKKAMEINWHDTISGEI